jgi:predicted ATPase
MSYKRLSRLVLQSFKSIRQCDLKLGELNVLIGANGAGKSNFMSFFCLLQQLLSEKLQLFVSRQGGPDSLLHFGRKKSPFIRVELYDNNVCYCFSLEPTQDNRLTFTEEKLCLIGQGAQGESGHFESKAENLMVENSDYREIISLLKNCRLYHFHDTGDTALVKQLHSINDNLELGADGRNLAAFLYRLQKNYSVHYQRILKTVRLAAPFFDDFLLREHTDNKEQIELEWLEKGESRPFKSHLLSDGTLRFICLTTLLMQPEEFLPEIILVDEPELGLHPFAANLLASMLRSMSKKRQIIISTQSAEFLNEFAATDIIVVDRTQTGTEFRHLDITTLESWLSEYSLGELWQKNLLGGRPS